MDNAEFGMRNAECGIILAARMKVDQNKESWVQRKRKRLTPEFRVSFLGTDVRRKEFVGAIGSSTELAETRSPLTG